MPQPPRSKRPPVSRIPELDALLARVDISRRSFLERLLSTGALAGPAVASLALPGAALAATQVTTAPTTTAMTFPPMTTVFPTTPAATTTVFLTTPPAATTGLPTFTTTPPMTTGFPTTSPAATTGFPTTPPVTTTTFPTTPVTTAPTTSPPFMTTTPTTTTTPPPPTGAVLGVQADTFIRHDEPNTNEGANPVLRVGVGPVSRGLVQFDRLALLTEMQTHAVASAVLVVTIANNHNTWGQEERRGVEARPLDVEFIEGNGAQATLPQSLEQRAYGAGATWNSPADPDCHDDRPGRRAPRWRRNDIGRATAPVAIHSNHQTGDVSWDVTADVIAGASGWMLVVADDDNDCRDWDEERGPRRRRDRHPGRERFRGEVEYYSREGADEAGDVMLAPRLIITYA